jgi:alpha-tubulin suppressor-like RCC1 family protein
MTRALPVLAFLLAACGPRPAPPNRPDGDARPLPSASQIEELILSPEGSCGRLEGKTAICWGGWGTTTLKVSAPAAGLAEVAEIKIGHDFLQDPQRYHDHLCARVGTAVQCWGNGEQRQIGPDAGAASPTPAGVAGLPPVTQLALGARHSCALTDAGEVWCWGGNHRGQTGAGPGRETIPGPAKVAGLGKVTQIATAILNTCALTDDHEVYCWGENLRGEAGAPNVEKPVVWAPNRITFASGSRQVSGDYSTLCALKVDGTIACWGYLTAQLGTAFEKEHTGEVPDIADATQIAVGYSHACALRQDQTVWCWGQDEAGQLGDGGGEGAARPKPVALPGRATAVVAASKSTCARLEDRRWYCWGENRSAQIGPRAQPVIARPARLDLSQVDLAGQ